MKVLLSLVIGLTACFANAQQTGYVQTNLVADTAGIANNTDPQLLNPWGIAFFPGAPFWIANNDGGTSTLYDASGNKIPLVVQIPSASMNPCSPGCPTGIVANSTGDFGGAFFLFDTEDGILVAWSQGTSGTSVVDNSPAGAVYKALALLNNSSGNFLLAANFHSGTIDVFDRAFKATSLAGTFTDPNLPAGYAPHAVHVLNNQVYVAYALQDAAKHDPVNGPGNGVIDIFDVNGSFVKRLTSGGTLNSPWGVAIAPSNFGQFSNAILVGNFGDGAISAFDPSGNATGQLSDSGGKVLVNPGLWELVFGQTPADADTLYFTAGGADETHGLFATLVPATALQFVAVTPCRLVDTRKSGGPIQGDTSRDFTIPQLGCNIPTTAGAYSLNVTVVPSGYLGSLTIWPTGEDQPVVSTMNSFDGRIKANAAIVPAGTQGAVSVYVGNTTDVVLDIDGYFAPTSGSTLAFYSLTPCRVADTRKSNFPQGLGSPHLSGGVARDFPVLNASSCNIPSSAQAYSLNFTAVPYPAMGNPLGYLELWPTGQKPANPVSTLNNLTGTIVANAAIVPAGTGADITAYASNDTDLVIDINGYFAPAGQNGLSLYPVVPCRVIITDFFNGLLSPPVDVVGSPCSVPSLAQVYVFNASVLPGGELGYLTLWPDGESQPVVSTLNAIDGAVTSNMAVVPTTNGKVDAYAAGDADLFLDISSYFAP